MSNRADYYKRVEAATQQAERTQTIWTCFIFPVLFILVLVFIAVLSSSAWQTPIGPGIDPLTIITGG
jgi:hypothetical protein